MKRETTQAANRKQKPVEIVGIVAPLGCGGGRFGNETLWTFRTWFVVWRNLEGELDERRLVIFKPKLTDAKLKELTSAVKPYDVLRVRIRLDQAPKDAKEVQGELVSILGKDTSDTELLARVGRLQKPVKVKHPYFGTLTLNRALNWYEANVKWNGKTVGLALSRNECDNEDELFAHAQSLWKRQKTWDKQIRGYAAAELLDLKNDLWLGEDEQEFTAARFKKRMTLETVSVYPDGSFEFTFADGNLFWGHVIQVNGSFEKGLTSAGIAG